MYKVTSLLVASWFAAGFLFDTRVGTLDSESAPQLGQEKYLWETKNVDDYLGYESCRKCHQLQIEKLISTTHFKSFETAHRSQASKKICKQLGIRSIKRDARCVRCHYTPEKTSRGIRAQSGISCESCHGPSRNWVQGHNDYGGLTITKAQETTRHKNWRIENSITKGMRHPSNLFLLAKSCYECHLVDDPEIVNRTDHPPISLDFNMVAWSQGSIRHNFLRTDNKYNAESPPERLRVMFVCDLIAKLEASLKAMAKSQAGSKHYAFVRRLYESTAKELFGISKTTDNSEIRGVVEVLKRTPPDSRSDVLISAASSINELGFQFGKSESGHLMNAIDELLPGKDDYR